MVTTPVLDTPFALRTLTRSYISGSEADSAHLVMNLAMAKMLTSQFTPTTHHRQATAWEGVLAGGGDVVVVAARTSSLRLHDPIARSGAMTAAVNLPFCDRRQKSPGGGDRI